MRNVIAARGLPLLLLLMAIAVILILSGATALGFVFGLIVAGLAGLLLVSLLAYEVASGHARSRSPQERRLYRAPRSWPTADS